MKIDLIKQDDFRVRECEFWRERGLRIWIMERNSFRVRECEFWRRWILIKQDDMVCVGADEFWRESDEQNWYGKKDDRDNEIWKVLPNFDALDLWFTK